MRKHFEQNLGNIFVDVIGHCFFSTRMLQDKLSEIQYFFFIEKETTAMLVRVDDPLVYCLAHLIDRRIQRRLLKELEIIMQ